VQSLGTVSVRVSAAHNQTMQDGDSPSPGLPRITTDGGGTGQGDQVGGLIAALRSSMGGDAEEAQAELIRLGAEVIEPLIAATPSLPRLGQVCAIEVFRTLDDRRAGPTLVNLLQSDYETVRSWSAEALGALHIAKAVPALEGAYKACFERGTPPHWLEPTSIRWALTALGARLPVIPPVTARLMVNYRGRDYWPRGGLFEVLADLADHDQVVAYMMVWRVAPNGDLSLQRVAGSTEWDPDWNQPWPQLVRASRDAARNQAALINSDDEFLVSISWLDHSDVRT
jgi:hypothetical protein